MSRVQGREPLTPHAVSDTPRPGVWNVFCFCFAALGIIWLPLAILDKIDALLAFLTKKQLLDDAALALALLAVSCAALAIIISAVGRLLRSLGASDKIVHPAQWALVCMPVMLLCAIQSLYAAKHWIESVTPLKLTLSAPYKRGLLLAFIVIAVLTLKRWQAGRAIRQIIASVLTLRFLALAALGAALVQIALHPPTFGDQANPTAAKVDTTNRRPDIFVISFDSLAAADANLCGELPFATMPHLRALAAQSSCFTSHYSVSTITQPTTTTIETGVLPWSHWVVQGGRIPPQFNEKTIGIALRNVGYEMHSISAASGASPLSRGTHPSYNTSHLVPSNSLFGKLNHLLHKFPDARSLPYMVSVVAGLLALTDIYYLGDENPYPAQRTFDNAATFVKGMTRERAQFLWVHAWPPHSPYLPAPNTKYKLLPRGELDEWSDQMLHLDRYPASAQPLVDKHRLRYRESIMDADEALGGFLETLRREGRLDDAVIVVTGDHGESFERGFLGHSSESLHEPTIKVPLLVKLPRQTIGRKIDQPTSQVDLGPTLLDLAGAAPLTAAEGRSMRELLQGGLLSPAPVFSMAIHRESRFRPLSRGHYAVIDGRYKLVYHQADRQRELYDLGADPQELSDLSSSQPDVASRLLALLHHRIEQAEAQRRRSFEPADRQEQ